MPRDGHLDPAKSTVTWKLRRDPSRQRDLRLRYEAKHPKGRYPTVE